MVEGTGKTARCSYCGKTYSESDYITEYCSSTCELNSINQEQELLEVIKQEVVSREYQRKPEYQI